MRGQVSWAVVLACALAAAPGEAWAARAAAPQPRAPESIITRVDNGKMRIAITFDACATKTQGYGFDRPVYHVLRRERIPATIFVSGRWVEFHPQVMTQLAADPLIEFGDHSYDHPHMSRLNAAAIGSEIDQTEGALGLYGKHSVAFRPPFGDFNAQVVRVAHEKGLPVILWDVVSGDPSAAVTAEGMIREVSRRTRPGSVVIFHINGRGWKTAAALPTILHHLRARGFEFVHVSTLLASGALPEGVPSEAALVVEDATDSSQKRLEIGSVGIVPGPTSCEPPGPWESSAAARAPAPVAGCPSGSVPGFAAPLADGGDGAGDASGGSRAQGGAAADEEVCP